MKFIRIVLLLSLICFINQSPVKAADKKNDSREQISLSTKATNAGAVAVKTGMSLAQLATGGIGALAAFEGVKILSDKNESLKNKSTAILGMALFSVVTATLLKASWNNGKSVVQTLRDSLNSSKKSDLTEPSSKQISTPQDGHTISKLARTALGLSQLAAAGFALGISCKLTKDMMQTLRYANRKDYQDYALGLGFWGTIGLTNLAAAWNNGKPAIQSLTKAFGRTKKNDQQEPASPNDQASTIR